MSDNESESWFSDIAGDGTNVADQLQAIKDFAYKAFDQLDEDKNGYLSLKELEAALLTNMQPNERKFLSFLLDNHEQITEACDEGSADGISRKDLDQYFELIATLL